MLTPNINLTTDPTTAMPVTDATDPTTDPYPYDPTLPPVPPNPTAEPFLPATTIPATTDSPRDRAYTLALQGYRSPAIAAHLGVPQRTIRHWIQMTNQELNNLPALDDTLDTLDAESAPPASTASTASTGSAARSPLPVGEGLGVRSLTTLQHQRTLAIERHRARSAAAWALHDQLRATLDPFLARLSERLLLHTQYPDDTDHVSMSTLALAGGPLSPAFRAMYHMLPGLITGLTRSLALAERADRQIDRLLALPTRLQPPPTTTQPTTTTPTTASTTASKQPVQEPQRPQPTSEDFLRAAEAARIAEEDADVIPHLTQRQRDLIRAYCALSDSSMETWNIPIDPDAPLTRWREVLLPRNRHRDDPDELCDPDTDPDDDPDPTPLSGKSGKSGKASGKASGNHPGKSSGKKIGNKNGNTSGNAHTAHTAHTPPPSPHGPFPPREEGWGLGHSGNTP